MQTQFNSHQSVSSHKVVLRQAQQWLKAQKPKSWIAAYLKLTNGVMAHK